MEEKGAGVVLRQGFDWRFALRWKLQSEILYEGSVGASAT